jgi:hypothetical protein
MDMNIDTNAQISIMEQIKEYFRSGEVDLTNSMRLVTLEMPFWVQHQAMSIIHQLFLERPNQIRRKGAEQFV